MYEYIYIYECEIFIRQNASPVYCTISRGINTRRFSLMIFNNAARIIIVRYYRAKMVSSHRSQRRLFHLHSEPFITSRVTEQASLLLHLSRKLYHSPRNRAYAADSRCSTTTFHFDVSFNIFFFISSPLDLYDKQENPIIYRDG